MDNFLFNLIFLRKSKQLADKNKAMLLIPIEHQNKINTHTFITWMLILSITYVSFLAFPHIRNDEKKMALVMNENNEIFSLETELYQEFLNKNKITPNENLTRAVAMSHVEIPSFLDPKKAALWLLAQKDENFQKALLNKEAIFTPSLYQKWKNKKNIIDAEKHKTFLWKWGFIPSQSSLTGLIASFFLHGHYLHLLVNLFFLWFLGQYLEERYGAANFLLLFSLTGFLSILFHRQFSPFQDIPLIGASGAISGLLGSYLVSNLKTKVKILYFIFPIWYGYFYVPTLSIIGFWGLTQLFGIIEGSFNLETTNIGFHAHIGGFLSGLIITKLFFYEGFKWRNHSFISKLEMSLFQEGTKYIQGFCYKKALLCFNEVLNINPLNTTAQKIYFNLARHIPEFVVLPTFSEKVAQKIYSQKGVAELAYFYDKKLKDLPYTVPLPYSCYLELAQHFEGKNPHLQLCTYLDFLKMYPTASNAEETLMLCFELLQKYFGYLKSSTLISKIASQYYPHIYRLLLEREETEVVHEKKAA